MGQWTGFLRRLGVAAAGLAVGVSLGAGALVFPGGRLFGELAGFFAYPLPSGNEAVSTSITVTPSPTPSPSDTLPESTPVPTLEPTSAPIPAESCPEGWGTILSQTYGQASGVGAIPLSSGSIKNYTSQPDSQVAAWAQAGLPFQIELNSDQPQVLIMHTHATETYNLESDYFYDPEWGARITDTARNVCAVGSQIAQVLNEGGINTLHDMTLHDYPSYNGSYAASNATVRAYLEQYPSIKVVLDIHRDAIEQEGVRVKPVTQIEGKSAAQVMIICGCDQGGNLPNFSQNLAFAGALEARLEGMFPTLTRPVLFDYRYYNQDLTTGSLLIEMGGHANTLEEALYSGELVGQGLVSLFTSP